jgi:hypothetical protein
MIVDALTGKIDLNGKKNQCKIKKKTDIQVLSGIPHKVNEGEVTQYYIKSHPFGSANINLKNEKMRTTFN